MNLRPRQLTHLRAVDLRSLPLYGIEIGQISTVIFHREYRVSFQAHSDVPRAVFQYDFALGEGKAYFDRGVDLGFGD